MCRVLEIPRSTYYKELKNIKSKRYKENEEYKEKILFIYNDSSKRYGAPKIHDTLKEQGHKISLKRVQRLMKSLGLRSIICRKFRPMSSKIRVEDKENILNRDFSTTTINEKWVTDITYVYTIRDKWCYLASVMDLHSRKIVGYAFSKTIDTDLAIKALDNAITQQRPSKSLILHSDLGVQYTSSKFKDYITRFGISHSFSRKGNPYDNACIESFHASLKKEEVNLATYFDYNTARLALFKYIESWYNRKRIHGSIGYITPQQCEDKCKLLA